jgi:molecular chaperone DnaK (HSP70)
VIAIDFGTSRSAYAFGFVGGNQIYSGVPPDSVLNEGLQLKAETSIVLDENLKACAFGLKGRRNVYMKKLTTHLLFQWFKMHLKNISSDNDESVFATDHSGKTVPLMTVISEALAHISQSAIQSVKRTSNSFNSAEEVHWIITVPAIWSPAASGFMRRAAVKAKMIPNQLSQKLTLVREPEGACLDLLHGIEKKDVSLTLPVGTEMLILDCGGGTNDMTFIKLLSLNPLRCQELKEASGGAAGASNIDKHIHKLLETIFSEDRYQKMRGLPEAIDMMDLWEQFKVAFDGKDDSYTLTMGDLLEAYQEKYVDDILNQEILEQLIHKYNNSHPPSERIERKRMTLFIPSSLIKKWFNTVVDVVISDLENELNHKRCQNIKFLYLVGGFCANRYLVEKITNFVNGKMAYRRIEIVHANNPDMAIVRGAVVSLLRGTGNALVEDHVSRCAYGLKATNLYRSGVHDMSKSYMASDGCRRVPVYILFVRKGDNIPLNFVTQPQNFMPITPQQTVLNLEMYSMDDESVTEDSIVYMDDPRVKKMISLTVPLNLNVNYDDRIVQVSIKFGMETQIMAKDKSGKNFENAECIFYAT